MMKYFVPPISLLFALIALCISLPTAFAATGNQFTVGVTVSPDTTPPSTPTGLAATSVSSTQINLSWSSSTDNVAVGGYVVRRNSTIIATTTAITYSDTGLAASTLYTYTVQAFDTSYNYSGTSASSSTTTASGSPGGGGGGDITPPTVTAFSPASGATGISSTTTLQMTMSELVNRVSGNITIRKYADLSIMEAISVNSSQVTMISTTISIVLSSPLLSSTQYYVEADPGTFADQSGNQFAGFSGNATWSFTTLDTVPPSLSLVSATTTTSTTTVMFTTSENALATLSWGTTTAYNDGTASELGYTTNHSIAIFGLAPGTVYYFRITAKDPSNNQSAPYAGTFTTQNTALPPDTTPPANPSALAALASETSVLLSWGNPTDPDFQAVRVMRKMTGYPATPSDGILVYDGAGQSVTDAGLTPGTTYYYTVFARDTSLNYSSGAIIPVTTLVPPPSPTPTPVPPSPTPSGGGSGGSGSTSSPVPGTTTTPFPLMTGTSTIPFASFPATGTPSAAILRLSIHGVIFMQPEKSTERLMVKNGSLRVDGANNISIAIPYEMLPDVLKTIIITIIDPNNNNKASLYLLSVNPKKTAFEAIIPAFRGGGEYPFTISIFDHENQGLARISAIFDVYLAERLTSGGSISIAQVVADTFNAIEKPVNNAAPYASPIGVAVGASQAILLATNVNSVYDLYLLLLKFIGLLTGLFRRKRNEPWGVVYDSVTKCPLDPAYIIARFRGNNESKGEAITDVDGRYGFLLNPGEYVIEANKTHYKFPSDKLQGRTRDEFYENLYFGNPFQVREGGVVHYNIPLDPIEFDWNEFAKNQDQAFRIYSKNETIRLWFFNIVFYIGFVFSALSFVISPTPMSGFVVLVYVGIAGFQIFWKATHKITRVINKSTGKPIPFALIRVWLSGLNTIIKKTVADGTGRFYFLVPPGTYYITVDAKQVDGSYKEIFRTGEIELKRGVVTEDFLV